MKMKFLEVMGEKKKKLQKCLSFAVQFAQPHKENKKTLGRERKWLAFALGAPFTPPACTASVPLCPAVPSSPGTSPATSQHQQGTRWDGCYISTPLPWKQLLSQNENHTAGLWPKPRCNFCLQSLFTSLSSRARCAGQNLLVILETLLQ